MGVCVQVMTVVKDLPQYQSTTGFRSILEAGPHARPHLFIGGTQETTASPDDPIFFLHHSFVDKLFTVWQDCHGYTDPEDITDQQFPQDLVDSPLPAAGDNTTR